MRDCVYIAQPEATPQERTLSKMRMFPDMIQPFQLLTYREEM